MQVYAGMVGVLFKLEAEHGRIDVISLQLGFVI